jgi:hypothetical protein
MTTRARLVGLLAAGAALAVVASVPAVAAPPWRPRYVVAADNLNNPRQLTVRGDSVYVAEAGTAGTACRPDRTLCAGTTGSVTRVRHGHATRIQRGLVSVEVFPGEIVGVDALTFRGDRLYGIASGTCDLTSAPPAVRAQAGKVLRLDGGTAVTPVGDASTIECTTDPDGQGRETDPYGLADWRGRFGVADAAGNDIVLVSRHATTVATVLSRTDQPVPTSLAVGPDGALYIGTLNFQGGAGHAAVYRLAPGSHTATTYASGLTAITGIAFGRRGTLYVAQFTTTLGSTGPGPDGSVVAVPWGGGTAGRRTYGTGFLHFPGGVAVNDGYLYVSNWSTASGTGPGHHGQLLRIPLG